MTRSILLLFACAGLAGCATTAAPLAAVASAGAGAAAGAAVTHGSVLGAGAGAVIAGGVAGIAVSRGNEAYRRGLDDGYVLGASDTVKRLYWALQMQQKGTTRESGNDLLHRALEGEGQ